MKHIVGGSLGRAAAWLIVASAAVSAAAQGGSSGQSSQSPGSLASPILTTNNPKVGETFRVAIHGEPGAIAWLAVSLTPGPSTLGPWQLGIGQPLHVLLAGAPFHGASTISLDVPIPAIDALQGIEFWMQALVVRPATGEAALTNVAAHRIAGPGRHVLIVGQVTPSQTFASAGAQADALLGLLAATGHSVTRVDNVLPADLRGYDAILDCRFTLAPPASEKAVMVDYLRCHGGIFLVGGPFNLDQGGQLRHAWIQDFLNTKLGIGVAVYSGGNFSGSSPAALEEVRPTAHPMLLTVPSWIAEASYHVENEGGNFGYESSLAAGSPWIAAGAGSPVAGLVFGATFKPEDMTTARVAGTVAVLWNGAADALAATAANPNTQIIFDNLVHFLDR